MILQSEPAMAMAMNSATATAVLSSTSVWKSEAMAKFAPSGFQELCWRGAHKTVTLYMQSSIDDAALMLCHYVRDSHALPADGG